MKIRILTYHFLTNNGAAMFCYTLIHAIKQSFPDADIRIVDYRPFRLRLYEALKIIKVFQRSPFFYLRRSRIFSNFIRSSLPLSDQFPFYLSEKQVVKKLSKQNIDCLMVGMDVWCITEGTERPTFPNIYWLGDLKGKKVAYAVSGYHSYIDLINKNAKKLTDLLMDFDLIGTRDSFTNSFVKRLLRNSDDLIQSVPDPTFLFENNPSKIKEKLIKIGVNFEKPLLGVLMFQHDDLMQNICKVYHAKGYQILALSMFNSFVDINLGDQLSPIEWAQTFPLLNFCLTNRFHGTIFSILAQIPFLSLQTEKLENPNSSKIFDLLDSVALTDCYVDLSSPENNNELVIKKMSEIQSNWSDRYLPSTYSHIKERQDKSREFLSRLKFILSEQRIK